MGEQNLQTKTTRGGRSSFFFENPPVIHSWGSVVGKKEGEGPLSGDFDQIEEDAYFGQKTWEQAESEIQNRAVQLALYRENMGPDDIDCIFAGDLLNQCIGTTFGLKRLNIPLLGLYGACSTMAESLVLAALLESLMSTSGRGGNILAVTSSHFCTAERQFRLPLSYGGQRTPTAQWTCTAGGAAVVSGGEKPPFIRGCTVGKIVDYDVTDANNMGAAMAPAAVSTLEIFLKDSGKVPADFDCIVTGDLGHIGSEMFVELLKRDGIDVKRQHKDCGSMIFDGETQDTHAGGSGCGCSASVLCGHFLPLVRKGKIKNMLFMATGALMSPTATMQGESIPSISHLLWISHNRG